MAVYHYVRTRGVRQLAKENGKRCGANFLNALDRHIYELVRRCCKQFNGHKTTLDETVFNFTKKEI